MYKNPVTIVLVILLLLCLAPMPYGFFQLVRFVAMVFFALFAYEYWNKDSKPLAITFVALAWLFQPFLKIELGRTIWNIVDVVTAMGLVLFLLCEDKQNKKKK